MMPDDLLNAQEVGRILHIKTATVYSATARGLLPCVILWKGRRRSLIRFRREDVEALIKSKRTCGPEARTPAGGGGGSEE